MLNDLRSLLRYEGIKYIKEFKERKLSIVMVNACKLSSQEAEAEGEVFKAHLDYITLKKTSGNPLVTSLICQ